MSRIIEVRDNIKSATAIIEAINKSELTLTDHQKNNVILSNICQNLSDINISLAIIADKLGGE